MHLKIFKRAAILAGVSAVALSGVLLGSSQAHALTVLGTDAGAVSLSPASGSTSTTPTFSSTEGCPTGYQGSATLYINDPEGGGWDQLANTINGAGAAFSGTFNNALSLELEVFPDLAGTTAEIFVQCASDSSGLGSTENVMDTFITFSADGTTYTTSSTFP